MTGETKKPAPSKAPYYCALYPELARIAREHGYALAVHGSLQRDFDLIAIPWVDRPSDPEVVIAAFLEAYTLKRVGGLESKPHGRLVQTLALSWGESFIDLCFMPAESYR